MFCVNTRILFNRNLHSSHFLIYDFTIFRQFKDENRWGKWDKSVCGTN